MTSVADGDKLAILVGGGPAPGINGVISSVTIEAINHGIKVFGFRDGYKWLIEGDTDKVRELTIAEVSRLHSNGGAILGASRAHPAQNPPHMERVLQAVRKLGITLLVSLGGGETAHSP